MGTIFRTAELNDLYGVLSPEERDELLQCLLIAAPRGGEAMVRVLEEELLCHAAERMLSDLPESRADRGTRDKPSGSPGR